MQLTAGWVGCIFRDLGEKGFNVEYCVLLVSFMCSVDSDQCRSLEPGV